MPKKPSARPLPPKACIGYVSQIDEPNLSPKGYHSMAIQLTGEGASDNIKFWLTFKPEFFSRQLNPDNLPPGEFFVYQQNLASQDNVPALVALLGDEAVEELDQAVYALEEAGELTGENVGAAIKTAIEAVNADGPRYVGYILRQQMQDTAKTDHEGKKIKIATPFYEIGRWYIPSKRSFARLIRRAADATDEKPFELAFDPNDYAV